MIEEVWKQIPGYEGLYMVSDLGRIRSFDRMVGAKGGKTVTRKGRVLAPVVNRDGYHIVTLCKDGKKTLWRVHRVVAIVFIPNPHGYNIVNHKDRNPSNNAAYNLEWCDTAYNVTYDGTRKRSSETRYRNKKSFKRVAQYDMSGMFISFYDSTASAAKATGCYQGAISNCCVGRAKTAGGYRWKYADGTDIDRNSEKIL